MCRGSGKPDRHQESGRRYPDRTNHLRRGPRRDRRRDQGARSGAAVESLRRAANVIRRRHATRAGIASAMRDRLPKFGRAALPTFVVVGGRKPKAGRIGKRSARTIRAAYAFLARAATCFGLVSVLLQRLWLSSRGVQAEEVDESHGMSVFGDLKYPADFIISTTSMSMHRRAGVFDIRPFAPTISHSRPSIRSTPTF